MEYYLDSRLIKVEEIVPVKLVGTVEVKGKITEVGNGYFTVLRTDKGHTNSKKIYEQTFNFNSRFGHLSERSPFLVLVIPTPSKIFLPHDVGYEERREILEKSSLIKKTE